MVDVVLIPHIGSAAAACHGGIASGAIGNLVGIMGNEMPRPISWISRRRAGACLPSQYAGWPKGWRVKGCELESPPSTASACPFT